MPKFYETDEFKRLNDKWQQKLKKKGFEDIEQPDGNLKTWSVSQKWKFLRNNPEIFEAKQTYYRFASQFFHDYEFSSSVEKEIWRCHTEGVSVRTISAKLIKRYPKLNKTRVHEIIQKLAKVMMEQRLVKDGQDNQVWLITNSSKKS